MHKPSALQQSDPTSSLYRKGKAASCKRGAFGVVRCPAFRVVIASRGYESFLVLPRCPVPEAPKPQPMADVSETLTKPEENPAEKLFKPAQQTLARARDVWRRKSRTAVERLHEAAQGGEGIGLAWGGVGWGGVGWENTHIKQSQKHKPL